MIGNKITKTIYIEGMHCAHCSRKVEETLKQIKGVKSVNVNLENKSAQIISKFEIEDKEIENAIKDIGFEVIKNSKN